MIEGWQHCHWRDRANPNEHSAAELFREEVVVQRIAKTLAELRQVHRATDQMDRGLEGDRHHREEMVAKHQKVVVALGVVCLLEGGYAKLRKHG